MKDSQKRELRARLRHMRSGTPCCMRYQADDAIAQRVVSLPEYQIANKVFTYLSMSSEVDTHAIIEDAWRAGKIVCLPRCATFDRTMMWHRVDSLNGLEERSLGVLEPRASSETLVDPLSLGSDDAFAIVPALCCDELGYRLGYGGGYYDVFLGSFPGTSVSLIREEFLLPSLAEVGALEDRDRPVDIVITQDRLLRPVRSRTVQEEMANPRGKNDDDRSRA